MGGVQGNLFMALMHHWLILNSSLFFQHRLSALFKQFLSLERELEFAVAFD